MKSEFLEYWGEERDGGDKSQWRGLGTREEMECFGLIIEKEGEICVFPDSMGEEREEGECVVIDLHLSITYIHFLEG